jgi:hypothetical protein
MDMSERISRGRKLEKKKEKKGKWERRNRESKTL